MITAAIAFAYVGGAIFTGLGVYLSYRDKALHPLLLVCISAISFSWIEAPYDWAMYAQFPTSIPRMPDWWPLDKTWGGLPSSVPPGYIAYFVLPAFCSVAIARRLSALRGWRLPQTLLTTGLVTGFVWALFFNAFIGARLGVFHYGRVIPGLALFEGTKHQYPLYDALAMGIQVMVFAYLLGRNVIGRWAKTPLRTVAAFVVVGHLTYGAVFAPHLITKLRGDVTSGPTEQLFDGVPNQPLHGG